MNKKISDVIIVFIFLFIVLLVFTINNFSPYYTKIIHRPSTNDSFVDISHLQGSCPRNRICSYPTCSLWSDINNNGICDRG